MPKYRVRVLVHITSEYEFEVQATADVTARMEAEARALNNIEFVLKSASSVKDSAWAETDGWELIPEAPDG